MRQLAAFVAVAETGTISAAAERLHLSPSALSSALTELERALKVQLCVRRRSFGIQLTRTGESVLVRARALLQQAGELESDALGTGGSVSGPIAIGCYPALGPTVLPSMIAGFTRENPDAQVEFREVRKMDRSLGPRERMFGTQDDQGFADGQRNRAQLWREIQVVRDREVQLAVLEMCLEPILSVLAELHLRVRILTGEPGDHRRQYRRPQSGITADRDGPRHASAGSERIGFEFPGLLK